MKISHRALLTNLIMLFVLVFTIGCGTDYASEVKPTKITVYENGTPTEVSADSATFTAITEAVVDSLSDVEEVYKGSIPLTDITSAEISIVLEMEEKMMSISSSDPFPVKIIAIPLAGRDFDTNQLLAAGGEKPSTFKTSKKSLEQIRKVAKEFLQ